MLEKCAIPTDLILSHFSELNRKHIILLRDMVCTNKINLLT